MSDLALQTDPKLWAQFPQEYPVGPYADQAQWAAALAHAYVRVPPVFGRAQRERRDRLFQLASVLPVLDRPGLYRTLWYSPSPDKVPLLVFVYSIDSTPYANDSLTDLADADVHDPSAVSPPVLDMIESKLFGQAARIVLTGRDQSSPQPRLQMTLVARYEQVLLRVDGFTADIEYGMSALEAFTGLLDAFEVVDDSTAQ